MIESLAYLNMVERRSGKTTAICKAAKEIGATVVCHSQQEAERVNKEHRVATAYINQEFRGTRGPFLVDTCAVSYAIHQLNTKIKDLEEKWNCTLCRKAYERGGCPSHGPSLVSGDIDG